MSGVAQFYTLMYTNLGIFTLYCIFFASLHYFIFRRYVYSIFDPFMLIVLSLIFYSIDIFFMYHLDAISDYYFYHFVFSQILFYTGIMLIKPIKLNRLVALSTNKSICSDLLAEKSLYYLSSGIFVLSQIASFVIIGIPLFMETRLMAYAGGGGLGILGRIIPVTTTITLFLLVDRLFSTRKRGAIAKSYDVAILIFTILSLLSTGAKSSILAIVQLVFLYGFFVCRFKEYSGILGKLQKFQRVFFTLAVVGAMGIIVIELVRVNYEKINPLIMLLHRFIQSGDIFMYAYQDNVIEQMYRGNPFVVMFADLIGMLRIISWDDIPNQLGNQLYRFYAGDELPKGPNPVHNVFGLFYFGYWGSLIFSFVMGYILSFTRNKLMYILPKSRIGGILLSF